MKYTHLLTKWREKNVLKCKYFSWVWISNEKKQRNKCVPFLECLWISKKRNCGGFYFGILFNHSTIYEWAFLSKIIHRRHLEVKEEPCHSHTKHVQAKVQFISISPGKMCAWFFFFSLFLERLEITIKMVRYMCVKRYGCHQFHMHIYMEMSHNLRISKNIHLFTPFSIFTFPFASNVWCWII